MPSADCESVAGIRNGVGRVPPHQPNAASHRAGRRGWRRSGIGRVIVPEGLHGMGGGGREMSAKRDIMAPQSPQASRLKEET